MVARNPPRNMPQVNIPFMALKKLKGLHFWADERKRTGFEADAVDLTAADATTFTAKCQEYNELKDAAKGKDASKPDALKKMTGWALWSESFQNYLCQILSAVKDPPYLSDKRCWSHSRGATWSHELRYTNRIPYRGNYLPWRSLWHRQPSILPRIKVIHCKWLGLVTHQEVWDVCLPLVGFIGQPACKESFLQDN